MGGRLKFGVLDRYIGGQVLFATVFGVVVLCFVLVLGNIFKEMLPRLVDGQVSSEYFLRFILYVMPFSLVFTIPWGFLTAVLLVFGRLSADNELVTMRMAGVSTTRLCMPVFVLGIALSSMCWWINVSVAPKAKTAIEQMFVDMATNNAQAVLVPDQMITAFPGNIIFFRDEVDGKLQDLTLFKMHKDRRVDNFVHAKEAEYEQDSEAMASYMHLSDAYIAMREKGSDSQGVREWSHKWIRDSTLPAIDLSKLDNRRLKSGMQTNGELRAYLNGERDVELNKEQRNKFRSEISKRWSFSLACITLGLIGIPLGITAQRRETSIGFVLSLVVACIYFFFIIIGDTFSSKSGPLPHILMWMPNVLFLGLGVHLFRKTAKR
ncbi:LptF/LptG family permease [Sulfuriroseicoccus oceanibius]|uniref:LptF/LptG family permease n=1 Tax=Sulfuriroseicoccus oceanibius TaxID=2707525 RepID=A0A7T7JD12_9BACT|nr:LptF/LptG family permease [Sulfuriroseicoccus oceanibius]QQL45878.1 LptF/LptG family permease [Sulfuriroseicoccus oceanibius]